MTVTALPAIMDRTLETKPDMPTTLPLVQCCWNITTELVGKTEIRSSIQPGEDHFRDNHGVGVAVQSQPGVTTTVTGGVTEANPIPL
jgi:hypothetical protein